MQIPHIPVLRNEILSLFEQCTDGIVVDCTLGYGGHSEALLENNPNISLIACDQDSEAIAFSTKRLNKFQDRLKIYHCRFSELLPKLSFEIQSKIIGIIADIGVSSLQLDKKSRGFGFESEVLDMRMSPSNPLTADTVVNEYSLEELQRVLKNYSDLTNYKQIAQAIFEHRPFASAKDLCMLASKLIKTKKIHPATQLFQAIRIEVNDELGELEKLLDAVENSGIKNAQVAIISFHSLEDRIVKERFNIWAKSCICPSFVMRCTCGNDHQRGKVFAKKPIVPTSEEIKSNPRSRSSKLRVFRVNE